MDGTIDRLQDTANIVTSQMNASLEVQEQILSNGKELQGVVQGAHQKLSVLQGGLDSMQEKQAALQGVLQDVWNIVSLVQAYQGVLLGEVSDISSVAHLLASLVLSFIITTPKQLQSARVFIFLGLLLQCVCDRLLHEVANLVGLRQDWLDHLSLSLRRAFYAFVLFCLVRALRFRKEKKDTFSTMRQSLLDELRPTPLPIDESEASDSDWEPSSDDLSEVDVEDEELEMLVDDEASESDGVESDTERSLLLTATKRTTRNSRKSLSSPHNTRSTRRSRSFPLSPSGLIEEDIDDDVPVQGSGTGVGASGEQMLNDECRSRRYRLRPRRGERRMNPLLLSETSRDFLKVVKLVWAGTKFKYREFVRRDEDSESEDETFI